MVETFPANVAPITLVDCQIEDSSTIRYVLNMLFNKSAPISWGVLGIFRNTIAFVKKYEFSLIEPTLRCQLREYVENKGRMRYSFILAAELHDISIAADTIRLNQGVTFTDNGTECPPKWFTEDQRSELSRTSRWGFVDDWSIFDVSAWPIWELRRVPFEFYVALSRAQRKYPLANTPSNSDAAAKYFKELMGDLHK